MRPAYGRVAAAFAVVLMAGSLAACGGGHKLGKDEGRLKTTGEAFVARQGKALRPVNGSTVLHAGDRVEIRSGDGSVALASGGTLELRPPVVFRFAANPFLQSGEMLIEPDRQALTVTTDDAEIMVDSGATRLSRTLALTVTTYRGRSTITTPGSSGSLAVRAPRRATVATRGVLPDRADAAAYDANDPWDRRFLASAIELGDQLDRNAAGFARQLPAGEGTTPGFYRLLLPGLARSTELDQVLDPTISPADNLVGAALTLRGSRGTFSERWRDVFAFRDPDRSGGEVKGASVNWGLVAIDQDVTDLGPLFGDVDAAIGRAPKTFVAPLAPPAASTATVAPGAGTTATTVAPSRTMPTTTQPSPPNPVTTSTTQPPTTPTIPPPTIPPPTVPTPPTTLPAPPPVTPVAPPPATGTPLDKIVDPLVDTLNGLLPPGGTALPSS
jgi:hypothetical protein